MDEYLDALEKEIAFTAEVCKHKVLNSVYIGGGTPTTLSAEQMDRLLTMIGSYFGIADEQGRMIYADEYVNEIDVIDEARNPMAVSYTHLKELQRLWFPSIPKEKMS